MRADDDGFVGNPKKILKIVGGSDDDLKILVSKRFILSFETGVIVIKHWLIHNQIRKDRYNETQYLEEKNTLEIKKNNSYTEIRQPVGNQLATQYRLGKVSIGKDREDNTSEQSSREIPILIDLFKTINPSYKKWFGNKTQRASCSSAVFSNLKSTL